MFRKQYLSLLLIVVLSVIFASCSRETNTYGEQHTVKIAFFPNINHGQALVMKNKNILEEAFGDNTAIEWKQFNSGTAEVEALFAGEVDIGYIGPGPAINAFVKSSGDIGIISGTANGGSMLVSRKDVLFEDINDINEKRIGIPSFGNTQDLMLKALLREHDMKDTSAGGNIEIIPVKNSDVKTLFDRKELDMAMVPEPWGSILVCESNGNIALDYNEIWRNGDYPTTVVIARREFLEKYPDIVDKFLNVHLETTKYINNNPEESKQIIGGEIDALTGQKIDSVVLDSSFERIKFTVNPGKDAVISLGKILSGMGFIKEIDEPDNIFLLDMLNQILRKNNLNEIK